MIQYVHVALAQLNKTELIATPSLVLISGMSRRFISYNNSGRLKKDWGSDSPTVSILVYNMYDKDEETHDNCEADIKE